MIVAITALFVLAAGCLVFAVVRATGIELRGVAIDRIAGVVMHTPLTGSRRGSIAIAHGRITGVTPADDSESGSGSPYAGLHALPGLVDLHVHLPPWFAPGQTDLFTTLLLGHGVTTIRETGTCGSRPFALRESIRSGARAGPRIFACGTVLDGDPPTWPLVRVVRDAAEARAAVDDLAEQGADCIKVYSGISDAALAAIRDAAHERGLPVIGHLPAWAWFDEPRLDEIEHVCDPRCWEIGKREIAALVAAAREHGIAHTPTLVVFEGQLRSYEYETNLETPLARLIPRFWREVIWNPRYGLGFTAPRTGQRAEREAMHRSMVDTVCDAVRQLHAAGVRVLPGSDSLNPFVVPGASLYEELRLFVRCGFTPAEALVAATWQAGEALGVPGLGRIESGAPADLLIFREDPTRDLAALDTLEAVVADGRLYRKADLDAALARQRERFAQWWFDGPSVWLADLVARGIARRD